MNETHKSILRILDDGKPELQVAAAQVLGEIRASEPALVRALGDKLQKAESIVAPFLVDALGQIGGELAVEMLVRRLASGGPLTDRVMLVLGQMGAAAAKELSRVFDDFGEEVRARILEILGRNHDREGIQVIVRTLFSPMASLAQKSADVLRHHCAQWTDAQRKFAFETIEKRCNGKTPAATPPESISHALTALASIDRPGAKATLLKAAGDKSPAVVRQAALRELEGVPLTATQAASLLDYVDDLDMTHVVRPTMHLLEHVDNWGAPAITKLKKLLEAESEEVRLFAMRALRNVKTAETAKLAFDWLVGSNGALVDVASRVLSENPAALDLVLEAFLAERRPDRATMLARPLRGLKAHFAKKHVTVLSERFLKLYGTNDTLADVALSLLLEVAPAVGSEVVVDRAVRLRKARKLADCVELLLKMAQSAPLDGEARFQLAVARLLMDGIDSRATRAAGGDATMGHFAMLIRDEFPVLDRLKKESQLSAEALLRVGTHFAGSVGAERRFGGELLKHVAEKHKRIPAGEEARQLLRVEGL